MLDKTLSNGYTLPHMAIGTNWMKKNELVKILVSAIEAGFRAFDTARDYGSEDVVGDAVKESLAITGLGREDVFITTKIGNSQQVKGDIKRRGRTLIKKSEDRLHRFVSDALAISRLLYSNMAQND